MILVVLKYSQGRNTMTKLFKNGYVYTKNGFEKKDFTIVGNTIRVLDVNSDSFDSIVDCSNCIIPLKICNKSSISVTYLQIKILTIIFSSVPLVLSE